MHNIKLKTGATYPMAFSAGGSTGYTWSYAIRYGAENITIRQETEANPPPLTPGDAMPDTYEARVVFIITAIQAGVTEISFFLSREWEKEVKPVAEELLNIEISN